MLLQLIVFWRLFSEKGTSFSAEKCELLKIKCNDNDGFEVNSIGIKVVESARYLGDLSNIKGDNFDTCRERHLKATDTFVELCSLSRGLYFGIRQIESMLILYKTVFVSRLIYSCEAWSNLKAADHKILQSAQLNFVSKILEVPGQHLLLLSTLSWVFGPLSMR